jgi:hypothetical protein
VQLLWFLRGALCTGHVDVQHLLPVVRCKLCAPSTLVTGCLVMLGTQRKLIDQIKNDRQQETTEGSVLWLLCAHQFCKDNARALTMRVKAAISYSMKDRAYFLSSLTAAPNHAVHITATS